MNNLLNLLQQTLRFHRKAVQIEFPSPFENIHFYLPRIPFIREIICTVAFSALISTITLTVSSTYTRVCRKWLSNRNAESGAKKRQGNISRIFPATFSSTVSLLQLRNSEISQRRYSPISHLVSWHSSPK